MQNKKGQFLIVSIIIGILLIGSITTVVVVNKSSQQICGNNVCEKSETSSSCLLDCENKYICGDNICDIGESSISKEGIFATTCPQDCKYEIITCGDGRCASDETRNTCPIDCGLPLPICGNSLCEVDRTTSVSLSEVISCPGDCGIVCGDKVCNEKEICSEDCISSPYKCGNAKCEVFENIDNCPSDCTFVTRSSGAICGDGYCHTTGDSETAQNCPNDCNPTKIEVIQTSKSPTSIESTKIEEKVCHLVSDTCYDNQKIINALFQKQRPLVGGLAIQIPANADNFCTLGSIIIKNNKYYGLTAGHCFDINRNFKVDDNEIGLSVSQGGEIIGKTLKGMKGGLLEDIGIISIDEDVAKSLKSYLGDNIQGWESPKEGMNVFKIGAGSGLKSGKVIKVFEGAFRIESDIAFGVSMDSGSVVLTRTDPAKIVGIIILGGQCADNPSKTCVVAVSQDAIISFLP